MHYKCLSPQRLNRNLLCNYVQTESKYRNNYLKLVYELLPILSFVWPAFDTIHSHSQKTSSAILFCTSVKRDMAQKYKRKIAFCRRFFGKMPF